MTEIKCIHPKYRRILLLSSSLKIQVTKVRMENLYVLFMSSMDGMLCRMLKATQTVRGE